jgi:hypothetical protein
VEKKEQKEKRERERQRERERDREREREGGPDTIATSISRADAVFYSRVSATPFPCIMERLSMAIMERQEK